MAMKTRTRVAEAGSALLAVLGAVATLSTIAFAMTVAAHNSLDRASLRTDSTKAYFLARGGIEATLHELSAGLVRGNITAVVDNRRYVFQTGIATVAIASENGKLNVNRASREAIASLLGSVGAPEGHSESLADGILAYRRNLLTGRLGHFAEPLAAGPARVARSSFERRSASIQVIEELLAVPGITPDLLYGTYRTDTAPGGRPGAFVRVDGLQRFLRTDGPATVDINAAPKAVLLAAGLDASLANQLVEARQRGPLSLRDSVAGRAIRESASTALTAISAPSAWTITSTGVLRGRRSIRTVSARVGTSDSSSQLRIRQWYEHPL